MGNVFQSVLFYVILKKKLTCCIGLIFITELVLDSVFDGLSDEVVNLKEIRKLLKDKIVKAKGTSNLLEAQINNIDRDLQNKQHSLSVGKSIINNN